MTLRRPFNTPHETLQTSHGTVQTLWRIGAFALLAFLCAGLASALLTPPLTWLSAASGEYLRNDALFLVVGAGAAHAVMVRAVDHRPWSAVWLGRDAARVRPIVRGALLGALTIGLPILALLAIGALRFTSAGEGSWAAAALRATWVLVPAALAEELVTRGYLLMVIGERWGWRVGVLVTSLLFGALHFGNPGWTGESIAMVALAGIFLASVILATGSLYAGWAAHFAWNWVMAALFHSSVSGLPFEVPNYQMVNVGPTWLTGGGWGPEGGAAAGLGMMAALVYLWRAARPSRGVIA